MTLNLLVLYVADLVRSREFYELVLGQPLTREQHGDDGPVHYAAVLPGGTVLELYPAPAGGPVTRVRLGFDVLDRDAVVTALRRARFTVKRTGLAIDPDGNRIELQEAVVGGSAAVKTGDDGIST